MNALKCKQCRFYDPLTSARMPEALHGWCVAKSVYPHKEGPGQLFPPGARRAENPEAPAKPVIVRGNDVVTTCTEVQAK